MKHKWLTSIVLIGVFCTTACDEPGEITPPGLTEEEITQNILDRIEKNDEISYSMFDVAADRLPGDSLVNLKGLSEAKDEFLSVVANQSEDFFFEVVEEDMSELEILSIPTPFADGAENSLRVLTSRSDYAKPANLANDYSTALLKQLDEQAGKDDHKEWIIIESVHAGQTAGTPDKPKPNPNHAPSESISLNYEKMKFLLTKVHPIILNMNLTDGEVWVAVGDILGDNDIPPVTTALLLPAVQKIREAGISKEPFGDAMNIWLDGPVGEAINGGLNRDIIRRMQATIYLAGLNTLMAENYRGATVDEASLSLLHARYRAALIVGSETVWESK